jgi:hypothetical protein
MLLLNLKQAHSAPGKTLNIEHPPWGLGRPVPQDRIRTSPEALLLRASARHMDGNQLSFHCDLDAPMQHPFGHSFSGISLDCWYNSRQQLH